MHKQRPRQRVAVGRRPQGDEGKRPAAADKAAAEGAEAMPMAARRLVVVPHQRRVASPSRER